jgi:hypothetical protein
MSIRSYSVSRPIGHSRRGLSVAALVWFLACAGAGLWLISGSGQSGGRQAPNQIRAVSSVQDASATGLEYRPIESIHVGQRVVTPAMDAERPMPTAVDPCSWKLVRLRMERHWEDGTLDDVHVETLQSPAWLAEHQVKVGGRVQLPVDLSDLAEPDNPAEVEAVEPCPPIERRSGRVVLSTIEHLNNFVFDLSLRDGSDRGQVVAVTGWHKFYSESRGWVSACELSPAETLRGRDGPLTVVSLVRHPGVVRVYNMTVEDEHVYYVSDLDLLAHNADCHHIMTNKNTVSKANGGPFTPKFNALAKRRGISLDDPANTMDLPGHQGPHPAYNAEVLKQLQDATKGKTGQAFKDAFDDALNNIRTQTATPGSRLNKLATGG